MRLNYPAVPAGVATAHRRRATMAAVAVLAAAGLPAAAAGPTPAAAWRDVVVTGSDIAGAARAVQAVGGHLLASLPLTHGVAARLPQGSTLDAKWVVSPQREITVAAAATPGSGDVSTVRQMLGMPADGDEGRGVTVAVVDTGIADVPDLAGRVSDRVDLTGTGAGDGYGHGTFMAGLIAASGAASDGAYRGVAPKAKLIDVKVADAQGRTDLITVLRGLQWVSDHGRDVQVLNLSLSSNSPLPYQIDPLTQALESLWHHGITVVVPSGNDGPGTGSVTSPGNDPVLLTAGGLDALGTAGHDDDLVGAWSGRGPTWQGDAKPDLVAVGGHVVSLRSPGSMVDQSNPLARIGVGYFRGSGTSMAAAVTSGVVAGALAEQPGLRPDAVKNLLTTTTYTSAGLNTSAGAGAGGLDAIRVLDAAPDWRTNKTQARYDTATVGRDARRWASFSKAVVDGDADAATEAWEKLSPASRDRAARAWADVDWSTRAWSDVDWSDVDWSDVDWSDVDWSDVDWSDVDWSDVDWSDVDWSARAWAADQWSARAWAWMPQ
jgi:serine protease AprX